MAAYVRGPLFYTWALLVAATVFSWWLGLEGGGGLQHHGVLTALSILLVAIVKCRFVMRTFMEVRFAPSWLKWACDGWLLLNFGLVSAFYWATA